MRIKTSEKVSFYPHLAGALLAFTGMLTLLLLPGQTGPMRAVNFAYGLSTVFLFSASSIYHAFKQQENETGLRRKLDHFAIFVMIAGTYTGIGYYYLDGAWAAGILIAQWTLVVLGAVFKFLWINAPRRLNTAIYVAMGWMAIMPIKMLYQSMPTASFLYLFGGGIAFTAGAIMYSRKKPF
jgi:hemolysin III